MKRFLLAAALLGTLVFAAAAPAQARPYAYYRRPVARAGARVVLPPYVRPYYGPGYYGPRYYGPRVYRPGPYWGPGYGYGYGYRSGYYGYGPGAYIGFGIY